MNHHLLSQISEKYDFSSFQHAIFKKGFRDTKGESEQNKRDAFNSGFVALFDNRIQSYSAKDCSELYLFPKVFFKPKTVDQLRMIIQTANQFKLPITFASGKTGLSAAYSNFAVLIDLDRISISEKPFQISDDFETISVDQSVLVSDLIKYVPWYTKGKKIFPIQPSSAFKLPVKVGGLIGSNASGVTSGKLGACDQWIKKMQIMGPDASIKTIESGSEEFKTVIGGNGYYGIVLNATFQLYSPPSQQICRAIYGKDIRTAFLGLQVVQDTRIFPLVSEFVMSPNGLLGKLGQLSRKNTTNWVALIKGTKSELESIIDIMNKHSEFEFRDMEESEFRELLEERTNQALLADGGDSDLQTVKFPGFEDILAPPAKISQILDDINIILKKQGFDALTVGYGHLNFRMGKGILIHTRIPVPIDMLVEDRHKNLHIIAQTIVDVNLLLRDTYGIRAKAEHSGGVFGIWFDDKFRKKLVQAINNGTAFENPHLVIYSTYKNSRTDINVRDLLVELVHMYLSCA